MVRNVGAWVLGCFLCACGHTTKNSDPKGTETNTGGSDGSGASTLSPETGGTSGTGGSGGSADSGGSGGSSAAGGSGASGGSGGSSTGGASGSSGGSAGSGVDAGFSVEPLRQTAVDKLDVLFVIDNSISMADKQPLLGLAVPRFIDRLLNPDCVRTDDQGRITDRTPADPGCPDGYEREFDPVDDMHLAVITSSLGGHGGDICSPNGTGAGSWNETKNDRAHLLPTVRPDLDLPSSDPAGFLAWNPDSSNAEDLAADFAEHVTAAGETGCGYEATLEAWYRFLVDPSPALDMVVDDDVAVPTQDANGMIVDTTVLEQREAFLRPDSAVVVIMLSDENDCSVVDGGIGWLTSSASFDGGTFNMPAATSACDSNPNDPCCRSCGLTSSVAGCPSLAEDANCQAGRDSSMDALNLRCYNQKQRFGFDLLYPVERYVDALQQPTIYDTARCDSAGNCPLVVNPLFDPRGTSEARDPRRVFLAGIVGVPWQDIAVEESLDDPEFLEFMSASELSARGRWQMILGDPDAENPRAPAALPLDPLMREQPEPREGTHPITGEAVAPETSTDPSANSINGHEFVNVANGDLQYACIIPLAEPRDCSDSANQACDCAESDLPYNRPLCNPPAGGAAGLLQYAAKVYPAPRLLQTLRDLGDNGVVGSLCPRVATGDPEHPAFGYNAAMTSVFDRTKDAVRVRCLPSPLAVDDQGQVTCTVVEVSQGTDCAAAPGRGPLDAEMSDVVTAELEARGFCGGSRPSACDEYSQCALTQLSGDSREACLTQADYPAHLSPGFCYLDAAAGLGDDELLAECPPSERRRLRLVGEDTPTSGAVTFVVCEPAD